jgi:hypothetical protein
VLEENRDIVEALRDALIERDELVGDQITDVIRAALARRPADQDRVIDLSDQPVPNRLPASPPDVP